MLGMHPIGSSKQMCFSAYSTGLLPFLGRAYICDMGWRQCHTVLKSQCVCRSSKLLSMTCQGM